MRYGCTLQFIVAHSVNIISRTPSAFLRLATLEAQSFAGSTTDNTVKLVFTSIEHAFQTFFTVIVDASDACNVATFDIGTGTGTNRQWNIKV